MTTQLSEKTVAIVKATAPVLAEKGVDITTAMYYRLFQDPDIAALFNQANQKTGAQVNALATAILAYARNIDNLGALAGAVERIAQKHIGYAIHPEHYPHVATALLGAIQEVLGEAATPEILDAWAEAYWFLANILIDREKAIRQDITAQDGGWTDWRAFTIVERHQESKTITSFVLKPSDGGAVIAHKPGQYLTLRFDVAGRQGLKRNYSISCGPNTDHYRISVKREPQGDASVFLHDAMVVGTQVECTPPAGDFFLQQPPEKPVILLSGGVGLTPMVSMLEAIAAGHPGVPTYFVHGTIDHSTHALEAHVRDVAARHDTVQIATFYESPGQRTDVHSGYVTIEWLRANTPFEQADFYLCGPRPFLRAFVSGLAKAGVPASRINYEFFGPADELLAA